MNSPEIVVWSAMLGGLATVAAFALTDELIRRSIASWRVFLFVGLVGGTSVLLTGITPFLLADVSPKLIHVLQNSMGLLSGALAVMAVLSASVPLRETVPFTFTDIVAQP